MNEHPMGQESCEAAAPCKGRLRTVLDCLLVAFGAGVVLMLGCGLLLAGEQRPGNGSDGKHGKYGADYRRWKHETCDWCAAGGETCRVALDGHHAIAKSTLLSLGLVELVNDEPRVIVTLCDCPKHQCHWMYGHLCNWNEENTQLGKMLQERKKLGGEKKGTGTLRQAQGRGTETTEKEKRP